MTTQTDALTLLDPSSPDTWPQGILAAAELREQRAKAVGGRGGALAAETEFAGWA